MCTESKVRKWWASAPLLGRELRGEQQLRDGDHAVQGRADLVAHVGQEHALRLGRRLRRHLAQAAHSAADTYKWQ
jgi:hypothetical protein